MVGSHLQWDASLFASHVCGFFGLKIPNAVCADTVLKRMRI